MQTVSASAASCVRTGEQILQPRVEVKSVSYQNSEQFRFAGLVPWLKGKVASGGGEAGVSMSEFLWTVTYQMW